MAVPTGTYQTYTEAGDKEDFHNMIYEISPTETPFISMAKKLKAKSNLHQWKTDNLAAASPTNENIEGDDATGDTAGPTVNLFNQTQLMDKVAIVSTTNEARDHYGVDSMMSYQVAKRVKELKRDLEAALCQNNASTAGAAGSAARMAGMESWLMYSDVIGSGNTANGTSVGEGAAQTTPGWTTQVGTPKVAPTDSTSTGSVSETQLKNCIARTWNQGGDPSIILCGAAVKSKLSTFNGVATRYREVPSGKQAQIIAGVDLFVSDLGEHKIVPSRFMRSTVLFGLDPEYVGVAYLQPFNTAELAKNGHALKRMVSVEATLVVQNPLAHFKIADISPTK